MQSEDIGPLEQANSDTIGDVKGRLVSEWAKLHADTTANTAAPPASITEVKLIVNGKFLENGTTLEEVYQTLADPGPDEAITMLTVLRPSGVLRSQAKFKGKGSQGCGCIIC